MLFPPDDVKDVLMAQEALFTSLRVWSTRWHPPLNLTASAATFSYNKNKQGKHSRNVNQDNKT